MTRSLLISALTPVHAVLCATIHSESFVAAERWSDEAFSSLLSTPGISGWMAVTPSGPAGFMLVRLCLDDAEILTLAVLPAFRRQSLGAALIGHAAASMAALGASAMFLEVSVDNEAALALYRKQGYVSCGLRRRYYHDGSDASVLRQDLRSATQ